MAIHGVKCWLGVALLGVAFSACSSDDAQEGCLDGEQACAFAERVCTVEAVDAEMSRVRCDDGVSLEAWSQEPPPERGGCFVEAVEEGAAPVVVCSGHRVVLGEPCPDGFLGDVYLGPFEADRWWSEESIYGGAAFLLSQCTVIHGGLVLNRLNGENRLDAVNALRHGVAVKARGEALDGELGEADQEALPLPQGGHGASSLRECSLGAHRIPRADDIV